MEGTSEKVLLHSCCAPCSAAILEWMGLNGYEPTILFYNPNIFPEEEYLKRKTEIVRYAHKIGVAITDLDGDNAEGCIIQEWVSGQKITGNAAAQQGCTGEFWERQHAQWLKCTAGMEGEPERGRRCLACFRHRLCVAADYAASHGFPLFTTTLASSRWKDIPGTATGARAASTNAATSSPASSTTSSTAAASSALPTALRPKATAHIPTNHKAPDIGLSTTLSINCTQTSCSMP